MNYQRLYDRIILGARGRRATGYTERHHVVPRALGGTNDAENLVALTAREHFIAHWLLAKMHGGTMWVAFLRMKGLERRYVNARLYEAGKEAWAAHLTGRTGPDSLGYGHRKSAESRKRIGDAQRGALNHAYGKPLSVEHAAKVSAAMKTRRLSDEHRQRIGAAHRGRVVSAETRAKQSAARKGRFSGPQNPMYGRKRPDLAERNKARARS